MKTILTILGAAALALAAFVQDAPAQGAAFSVTGIQATVQGGSCGTTNYAVIPASDVARPVIRLVSVSTASNDVQMTIYRAGAAVAVNYTNANLTNIIVTATNTFPPGTLVVARDKSLNRYVVGTVHAIVNATNIALKQIAFPPDQNNAVTTVGALSYGDSVWPMTVSFRGGLTPAAYYGFYNLSLNGAPIWTAPEANKPVLVRIAGTQMGMVDATLMTNEILGVTGDWIP